MEGGGIVLLIAKSCFIASNSLLGLSLHKVERTVAANLKGACCRYDDIFLFYLLFAPDTALHRKGDCYVGRKYTLLFETNFVL